MRKKRDKVRIWPEVIHAIAHKNPPELTTAYLEKELRMSPASACQVLRRLKEWGLLRVAGFAAPRGARGRRRKVYELTSAGQKKAEWIERNERR